MENLNTYSKQKIDQILFRAGVDTYNRFDTFLDIVGELEDNLFWYALINTYTNCDNLYEHKDDIKLFFSNTCEGTEELMTEDERQYLNNLPGEVTIYRGMTIEEYESKDFGVSWTTNKDVADFFADKYCRNNDTQNLKKMVTSLIINKKDVVAFKNERNEFEVIYINK